MKTGLNESEALVFDDLTAKGYSPKRISEAGMPDLQLGDGSYIEIKNMLTFPPLNLLQYNSFCELQKKGKFIVIAKVTNQSIKYETFDKVKHIPTRCIKIKLPYNDFNTLLKKKGDKSWKNFLNVYAHI